MSVLLHMSMQPTKRDFSVFCPGLAVSPFANNETGIFQLETIIVAKGVMS